MHLTWFSEVRESEEASQGRWYTEGSQRKGKSRGGVGKTIPGQEICIPECPEGKPESTKIYWRKPVMDKESINYYKEERDETPKK